MVTLKQIEALHWIIQLGTFEKAAIKLNTTQSAISKRILELETSSGVTVFDRSARGARLTDAGEKLLELGQQMMAINSQIMELQSGKYVEKRRLRLGVTELTALTWLPRLISRIKDHYPNLIIDPEVEMSRTLYERLIQGTMDLIIIPQLFNDPDINSIFLSEVKNVWMAKPGIIFSRRSMTLDQLLQYPILTQGARSGSGMHFNKWLKSEGVEIPRLLASDSLTAMLGLTVAGLGVSYLPEQCFQPLVDGGKLEKITVTPTLPPVSYGAMYHANRSTAFLEHIVALTQSTCDFSKPLQS